MIFEWRGGVNLSTSKEKKHHFHNGSSKHLYLANITGDHKRGRIDEEKLRADLYRGIWFTDFYEIYLCLADSITMFVNNKTYCVRKNDILIFNNVDFHRILFYDGIWYDRITTIFSLELLVGISTPNSDLSAPFTNRSATFSHLRHQTDEQAAWLFDKMKQIITLDKSQEFGADVRKKMLLAEILLYIHDRYQDEEHEKEIAGPNSYHKVIPILDYINDHFAENLSLDHLAKQFYMSKYYLCHIFKENVGHTVNEYITFRRMMRAASLLQEGYSSVRVCEIIGMKNVDYFITLFKKITGMTPRKYAERFKNNQY